jgi:hypothetical protein
MHKLLRALLLLLTVASAATPAVAATGVALGVDTDARAEAGADIRVLAVGSDVFIGDRVVTDDRGLVQIKFSDETELVVGPNSELLLEDYLLRSDGSVGKFAVNALSGTFRFVTGNGAKDDYQIKTPTGTIGIRGTAFDFFVTNRFTRVLMFHGSTNLCNRGGNCVTLAETCEVGESNPGISLALGYTDDFFGELREEMRVSFRYANNQSPLLRDFRLEQVRTCGLSGPPPGLPAVTAAIDEQDASEE